MAIKRKILITGGLGYIGSHVTALFLKKNYEVSVLDNLLFENNSLLNFIENENFNFYNCDIRDYSQIEDIFKTKDFDAVIHLAALVGESACKRNPEETNSINYLATINLAEIASRNNVKNFIFMSTASSYGVQDINEIANEETKLNPVSLYAISKINCENELLNRFHDNLNITIFRPSTVHGLSLRMRFDLMTNHFTADAIRKNEILIFGPEMWRPLMWVGEPARVFDIVLNSDLKKTKSQIFNLGSNHENFQKIDIANVLKTKFFPNLKILIKDLDPDLRSYRVNFDKIKKILNFETEKKIDKAIQDMINYLSHNKKVDPYSTNYKN